MPTSKPPQSLFLFKRKKQWAILKAFIRLAIPIFEFQFQIEKNFKYSLNILVAWRQDVPKSLAAIYKQKRPMTGLFKGKKY